MITALMFSGARAVVIDVCVVRIDDDAHLGWDAVKNFTYPMPLPVARAGYPCPSRPPTEVAAEVMGVGRVAYGPGAPWGGARFTEMHDLLERLVAGGPAGPPMYQREVAYPEENGQPVTMPRQRPLHLVVLGALHPAVAQLVGLYFIDRTAQPGEAAMPRVAARMRGCGSGVTFEASWR